MAAQKFHSIKSNNGFILPLTMSLLLFISLFCFEGLYQLNLNQSELKEQQTVTQSFLIFQSATADLCRMIGLTTDQQGAGTLIESDRQVNYDFKSISISQYQINLSDKSNSGSTLLVSFVYNKNTKQIEQWVNQ